MSILIGQQLTRYYGSQDLFRDLDFVIARGDKTGLVGPNGSGKTSLLRLLLGLDEPDGGSVHRARGLRIGYLPQKPVLNSQRTLYSEMESVFSELIAQQSALYELADAMATADDSSILLEQYAAAEQRFDAAGGYAYEARIKHILGGMGFGPQTYDWPISYLSGGQVTRALLARLLLEEPELLVLDEPTNYLDLQALEWLESYLSTWAGSLLVVSHDRYFLDKVVTRIWELNLGKLELYHGNYSAYLLQREERRLRQLKEFQAQQELIERTEEYIRRNKAGQLAKQARGRETRLARLERIAQPTRSERVALHLTTRVRSGDKVLMSEGVVIGYSDDDTGEASRLFHSGEILVQRGWRVALLGPNGAGKTTLLRTILGELQPLEGAIRLGASVKVGYLPQSQAWLDGPELMLDYVLERTGLLLEDARSLLGRFLFEDQDMAKPLSALSGGERSRLALAQLTLQGANLLILDEPTTHLDLAAQEVLQQVLMGFTGTLLFVSHDRYLVNALATHVWWIEQGSMHQFEGNYNQYIQRQEAERDKSAPPTESSLSEKDDWAEQKRRERKIERSQRDRLDRIRSLEQEIAELERSIQALNLAIAQASETQNLARITSLSSQYAVLQRDLAERLASWEAASGEE
ncbi:MAG: ABC-F family ATP-binding cassette domain-containing protein [Chloroflexi bacterium]|nr:ABC-F family ATP-binding cassette domain-containing protein [Chloroflexota bacterium]